MDAQKITSCLLAGLLLWASSCNRGDGKENTEKEGKGGSSNIYLTPQHHGINVDSCMIYVKYGTLNMPSGYDDSARATMINGKPTAIFPGLRKGRYYFYGRGWDPAIIQEVEGGMPYEITRDGDIHIAIPVTEAH